MSGLVSLCGLKVVLTCTSEVQVRVVSIKRGVVLTISTPEVEMVFERYVKCGDLTPYDPFRN